MVVIVRSSRRRSGEFGINLKTVNCPSCGAELSKFRKPATLHQTLWGGWTCNKCGCTCDKWGVKTKK